MLFLRPAGDVLEHVGQFFQDEVAITDFDLVPGAAGELMVHTCLSDFELGHDLVGWARATSTPQGRLLVPSGSTLRTEDDLVRVAMLDGERGVASDDSGGLFRFSVADGGYEEIDRDSASRICGLRLVRA